MSSELNLASGSGQEPTPISTIPNYSIPDWFLSDNVKTRTQLCALQPKIFLSELPKEGENQGNEDPQKNYATDEESAFVVCRQTFQSIRDTLASCLVADAAGELPKSNHGVIILRWEQTSSQILAEYVDALAKELGAALVTLGLGDFQALAASHEDQTPAASQQAFEDAFKVEHAQDSQLNIDSPYGLLFQYFGSRCTQTAAYAPILDIQNRCTGNEPIAKDEASTSGGFAALVESPLIVHVAEVGKILEHKAGGSIVARLRQSIVEKRKAGRPVVLVITGRPHCDYCLSIPTLTKRAKIPGHATFTLRYIGEPAVPETPEETEIRVSASFVNKLKFLLHFYARHHFDTETLLPKTKWNLELGDDVGRFDASDDNLLESVALQITGRAFPGKKLSLQDVAQVLSQISTGRRTEFRGYKKPPPKKPEDAPSEDEAPEISREEESEDDNDTEVDTRKTPPEELNGFEKNLVSSIIKIEELQDTKYEDVILDDDTKEVMRQIVLLSKMQIKTESSLLKSVVQISGALLYGPPGTGKTHLSRAIANSLGSNMLSLDSASLQSKWLGETEKYIKAAFSLARKYEPCIIFLDEVDALFYRRSDDDRSWQRSALTQFLQEMDGLQTGLPGTPFVLVATNRPMDLDTAFLRRLPQKMHCGLPSTNARAQILRVLLDEKDLDASVDINHLAKLTHGYSGSDLKNLCAEAALLWVLELSQNMAREAAERAAEKAETARLTNGNTPNKGDAGTAATNGDVASATEVKSDETVFTEETECKDTANGDGAATEENAAEHPENAVSANAAAGSETPENGTPAAGAADGGADKVNSDESEEVKDDAEDTTTNEPDEKTKRKMEREIKRKEKEARKEARAIRRQEKEEQKKADALYRERLTKVCLTNALFEKALQRMRPTVSPEAIREIEKFARMFDDK